MISVLVAFSGGVDSTLLLKVAVDTLGAERVVAFTEDSPLHQAWEMEEVEESGGTGRGAPFFANLPQNMPTSALPTAYSFTGS